MTTVEFFLPLLSFSKYCTYDTVLLMDVKPISNNYKFRHVN